MEEVEIICELVKAIITLVPTLVSIFLLIKTIIKEKNWQQVCEIVRAAMTAAEEHAELHPGMTGDEKFEFALAIIKDGLAAGGIQLDEALLKKIKAYIEELCRFTKTVNC